MQAVRNTREMKRNRKHGAGNLTLRGGIWQARWTFNGRTFWRSTGTGNRKEAEKRLAEYVSDYQRDGEAATIRRQIARLGGVEEEIKRAEDAKPALTLARAWDAYEGSLKRSPVADVTLTRYRQRFGIFVEWMRGHFPAVAELRAVSEEHVEAFMREVAAKMSGKTFNDYRGFLLQMWNVLGHDKTARLSGNPWASISRRERNSYSRRELTMEELSSVVASVDGEMRVLFAVGIYTGLRLGDAVSLDWGAVDLVRGFIDATPHKTQKHGTRVHIPISPFFQKLLEKTPIGKRRGPVTPELLTMYQHSDVALSERIQRVFRKCGIETQAEVAESSRKRVAVGFHSLRHSFVSLCANRGIPMAVVQSIVGHSNTAMTRHYFHVADEVLRVAIAALPDVVTEDAEVVEVEDAPQDSQKLIALPEPENSPVASRDVLADLAALLAMMDSEQLAEAARMINAAMQKS